MKRNRFAQPVALPCEQWQLWALDAPKYRSTGNLMHAISIDARTAHHMTVEMLPDPLPPVLQQYPLPRTEKPAQGNLFDCEGDSDGDDDDDDDIVDTFTLLAILESQKEAERTAAKSVPTVISVNANKKEFCMSEKHSHCRTVDPSVKKQSPVPRKGELLKHGGEGTLSDGIRMINIQPVNHFSASEMQREGCI
jgi:hypothetical protein